MLPETVTMVLPNNGTPVNEVATRIDVAGNKSIYNLAGHSVVKRKTVNFYRSYPKRTGDFNGVMKSSCKFTLDEDVANAVGETIVAPMIGEVNLSVPVGLTEAKVDGILDRIEAYIEGQRPLIKRQLFGPEV